MRKGSSIMNMMAGDAEKSLFTMANMWSGTEEEKKRRAQDVALLMLNPYFLMRMLVLFFWETGRELWEAFKQKAQNVQPRLNRLEHGYPFVRAAMCGLMRDISTNIAILDMMRGRAVHLHALPGLRRGGAPLGAMDGRRLWRSQAPGQDLCPAAPRRQGKGAAALQLYHPVRPRPVVWRHLQAALRHGHQGVYRAAAAPWHQRDAVDRRRHGGHGAAEHGGRTGQHAADRDHRRLQLDAWPSRARSWPRRAPRSTKGIPATCRPRSPPMAAATPPRSTSTSIPRKIKLSELEAAYPGMVDALVAHEGLGMVVGYEDDMTAVVLGKGGKRNLHTGEVVGADPVAPYAPARDTGRPALTSASGSCAA